MAEVENEFPLVRAGGENKYRLGLLCSEAFSLQSVLVSAGQLSRMRNALLDASFLEANLVNVALQNVSGIPTVNGNRNHAEVRHDYHSLRVRFVAQWLKVDNVVVGEFLQDTE